MSDFGAMISITKNNRQAFLESEFEEIKRLCEQYKNENSYTTSLGTAVLFKIGKTQGQNDTDYYEINILISNYWGDATDFKFHKKVDNSLVKTISKELSKLLPRTYRLKANFEWW